MVFSPPPPERLVETQGRLYSLWHEEMTLAELREALRESPPAARAYLVAERVARPAYGATKRGSPSRSRAKVTVAVHPSDRPTSSTR